MNDQNLNLNPNQISNGENESPIIPSSPEPKIDLRTLNSDLEQIQQTGGQNITGYQPSTQNLSPQIPTDEKTQKEENIIQNPEIQPQMSNTNYSLKPKKNIIPKILIGLLIIALILIGYFIIYPKIFTANKNLNQNNIVEENQILPPPPPPLPEQLPTEIETTTSKSTSTFNETNLDSENKISTLNLETIENYQSYSKSPNTLNELILNYLTLTDFKNLFIKEETEQPLLKEIIIKNPNNKILSLNSILNLIDPDFFNSTTLQYFEKNSNLFKYTNKDGQWLIFVLKLKNETKVKDAQDNMINLQKSPNILNYFLENVGEMQNWQDGKVKNKPTSLVNFTKTGATLSYTWFDKYLLLSTNLEGAEKVATLLGY